MPDEILMSIATTLATKAATGLYDLVKSRFGKDREAVAELEAADPERPETVRALAERLATVEQADAAFADELRGEWQRVEGGRQTATGGVNNQVTGTVHGKVLQAGDIHGDISF
ncbi:hypothetical protein FHX82_004246 [Amycolatopsis bartoniae]|uniref:Uncharacterized protein n=1 Tax=Amycolatopsis bartoniae TaxID=941986 RepID=A0A8H9IXG8_9PSEU|nr:hypothetical protein [Amycolatopsis bartoniae]MBB2937182.1 hypothetical protein [Amycolatopsis bartoniae]TVT06052.1 hypothetical protein FNH07_21935 [Amycolatopsis bartoniae]GHF53058.1 hypothetical protein GCM10017566_28050 [Amycolatopsis bartoniae]